MSEASMWPFEDYQMRTLLIWLLAVNTKRDGLIHRSALLDRVKTGKMEEADRYLMHETTVELTLGANTM